MDRKIRVAINGFGRIGRMTFRILSEKNNIDIVAINDLTNPSMLAHLLKHDSVHGTFGKSVKAEGDNLIVDGKILKVLKERDPALLPWKNMKIDIVVESTGFFRTKELASKHISAGAKKVALSAPAKGGEVKTVVLGVNDNDEILNEKILSNASCTTNCLAPVMKILIDNFNVAAGFMTTVHSYTNDQRILDLPHKDLRRATAASVNMIPTTTGATIATELVLPELKGKLDGISIRVPTPDGSLIDVTFDTEKDMTVESINLAMKKASETNLKGILQYSEEPLVSTDIIGNPYSAIFDSEFTRVIGSKRARVVAWYDNEWGYSSRLAQLVEKMGETLNK